MKFSVFTVMTPDLKPKALVSALKEFGYDGVEWRCQVPPDNVQQDPPSFWGNNLATLSPYSVDEQLEDIRTWTTREGIETLSVTPYLTCGDLDETERVLRMARKLGASMIRLGVPRYDRSVHYTDLYEKAVRYLSECEQLCKHYGVKGLVETHHDTIAPSASLAYRLVKSFDPHYIGVLYDPGNMVHEGYENYRMGLELLGPYLAHVHAKNAAWKHNESRQSWEVVWTSFSDGTVDWKRVLKDLKAVGYDGFIGMEDFSQTYPTKEALIKDIAYVKGLLEEVYE
ncbi:sugar phosphate isomerase/epimerase family protein [Halobacillus mangrovi]|uniref:Xylose isomerase n=1 Tax=Halobacillus mangrovi TaxID=402384 RepID=A0A1W5ZSV3_9BACI|nr:sugar phosphate isomerase/epimerase [Halobacillus mangrovi]ARI76359.1 xylose isomerase [Halobacillus mangrovi]